MASKKLSLFKNPLLPVKFRYHFALLHGLGNLVVVLPDLVN